jgi:hypothetical protein
VHELEKEDAALRWVGGWVLGGGGAACVQESTTQPARGCAQRLKPYSPAMIPTHATTLFSTLCPCCRQERDSLVQDLEQALKVRICAV